VTDASGFAHRPKRFWIAAALIIGFLSWFAAAVAPRLRLETNIFALLPETAENRVQLGAVTRFAERSSRELVLLVGTAERARLRDAGLAFARMLQDSGAFARVEFLVDDRYITAARAERGERMGILSARHRALLERGDVAALEREALRAAYTPLGFTRPFSIADDPLGLSSAAFAEQLPQPGRARLEGDMLVVGDGERTYTLLRATTAGDAYRVEVQKKVVSAIDAARAAATAVVPDSDVLASGLALFAAAGASQAMHEVAVFGGFDLVAIVVLIVGVFWLLRPLVFTLLTLGLATAAAVAACHYVFGKIHFITLTFGTSLIGVSVDYSLHYFVNRMRSGTGETHAHDIVPALILGCTTTVAGYLTLLVAPIPGLREIALFSAVGLATACAVVILIYPGLDRRPMPRAVPAWAVRLAEARPESWLPRMAWAALALGVAVLAALGWWRLAPEDGLRSLMAPNAALVKVEHRIKDLLGQRFDTRFVLVTAATPQGVVERLEALEPTFEKLVGEKALDGYLSAVPAVASFARQKADRALLETRVYGDDGALSRVMTELGFTGEAIAAARASFKDSATRALTLDQWLASPMSAPLRHLWLGELGAESAAVVMLDNIRNVDALRAAIESAPGARFVDQVANLTEVLRQYRVVASWVMAVVIAVMIGCLLVFYRGSAAIRTALPAAVGIFLTLATLGLLREPVNLFHVLSLLLVLGLGVDYAIILREGRNHQAVLAVLLSMTTTLISFGLLGFSSVPFVHSIGITVAFGVAFTFLIALATKPRAV
jgi:predicted exporter